MSKVRGGQVFVEIGADPRKLFKALNDLNRHIGRIGASMTNLGTRMTALGTALAAPLALASRQFATFDDAIRATAAVSGASGSALQSLNDKARELGATTSFTAVQVANLMTELGRAGFVPDEIERMTGAVLDLARATGTDATLASGIMAATLRQFGLQAGDAARAADVLTKAANATFNTVEGLGESLKYAGPVAKSLGMSLEDTVAVLGVLGNVGIQGSEAGTALRRLSVIAAGSGDELQKIFGITNTDAAGNLKPLVDILDEINQVTANMPVAERTAKMAQAFGLLGITSANVLSQTAGGVRSLAADLQNAEGTAARTAAAMDAGLGGAMRIATSAIEGTALAIGDALAPSLQAMIEAVTAIAGGLTTFVKQNQELVASAAKSVAIFTGSGVAMLALGAAISVASAVIAPLLSLLTSLAVTSIGIAASGLAVGKTILAIGVAASSVVPAIASAAASLATYVVSAGAAAAASVAAGAKIAGSFAAAVGSDIARLAAPLTAYAASVASTAAMHVSAMAAMVSATVTAHATMASSWVSTAIRPIVTWASTTAGAIGAYVASIATAVASTLLGVVSIGAYFLTMAMPSTAAFVASAVSGMGAYVASVFAALGATVASAAGIAAAWLAAAAPVIAIGAAIAGALALAYKFGGQIKDAFSGVGAIASDAATAIGGAFSSSVSGAQVVLGDLASTATTTFSGIYDAIAAGDLAGAMDILWAGLYAGWLRGVEALMNTVDPWISAFQNAFTEMGGAIVKTWDFLWTTVGGVLNTAGAFIQGAFDNIINGVMAAFDKMVATVRKSWNWVQSFIKRGYDLAAENEKVDNEMAARARQREQERPGIAGRTDQASRENERARRDQEERARAIDENTQATVDAREEQNRLNRDQRRADTTAAENRVSSMSRGSRENRFYGEQAADLLKRIQEASTIDQLRDMYAEFAALSGSGKLSDVQAGNIETALEDAQERISKATGGMGGSSASDIAKGAGAAGADAASSKAEVAGTFSAMALGGMGFGSSLAEQQLGVLKKIEGNTREEGALAVQP